MGRFIVDEFSFLDISKQRKYQLRQAAHGLCRLCPVPALPDQEYCEEHHKEQLRLSGLAHQRRAAQRRAAQRAQLPDII